jgi:hypothetical protein
MSVKDMSCSEKDCSTRYQEAVNMELADLEKLVDRCTDCEDGIIKSNQTAQKTSDDIGSLYAYKYNQKQMKG